MCRKEEVLQGANDPLVPAAVYSRFSLIGKTDCDIFYNDD